jgi:hypothetical protein
MDVTLLWRTQMMRFGFVVCMVTCVVSQAADTLRVRLIDAERFPAQPSEKHAVVRLPSDRSYARLTLHAQLSCPCGRGLGEWDYTVRFYVARQRAERDSSGNPITERIEIARFITPYAANRPSNWQWTWQWDVTDYRLLFGDSATVIIEYVGWTQSALFTVWLEAIEGLPPYNVIALDQIINGSFPYGNPSDPIDKYTTGKRVRIPSSAERVKLRITTTGHGFGGTDNAAEFSEKTHTIVVNSRAQFSQHLWRDDCGWNPVYPQDGTWPLARAGWCPGDVVYPWERWITPFVEPGAEATIDYRMQPFVNEQYSAHPSSYLVSAQVFYTTRPTRSRRAIIARIETPTDAPPMRRLNPSCGEPVVVVRNIGSDSITSLQLVYAFDGGVPQVWTWNAPTPLYFDDEARITLPERVPLADTPGMHRLQVEITRVNGEQNQEPLFHRVETSYQDVPTIPGDSVVIYFKTTRFSREQGLAWSLRRLDDDSLIAERRDLGDEVTDIAVMQLRDGCYQFRFDNPAGYGLSWWATQQQLGNGALWISANGKRVFTLDGDCGNGFIYNFRVGAVPQIDVPRDTIDFGATPVGTPVRRQLVIRAATSAALQVKSVQVSSFPANLGFRLASTTPAIPPDGLWLSHGDQLIITLEYNPPQEETRVRTATLTITSNDYDEPTIRILLKGTTPNAAGIDDAESKHWTAAPIPATDYVQIAISGPVHACTVVGVDGRQVPVRWMLNSSGVTLDCRELGGGVYAVVLDGGRQRQIVPIVVVR